MEKSTQAVRLSALVLKIAVIILLVAVAISLVLGGIALALAVFSGADKDLVLAFGLFATSLILVALSVGVPIVIVLAGINYYLKKNSETSLGEQTQTGATPAVRGGLGRIFNARILSVYVILWGVSLLYFFYTLYFDEAMANKFNPGLLFFGGLMFPGLYVVINNPGSIWKRIGGYVIFAVGLIIFLMLLI